MVQPIEGPKNDHTKGNVEGTYIYAECSWPRNKGDVGGLNTPPTHCPTGQGTISFWLNTYGKEDSYFTIAITAVGFNWVLYETEESYHNIEN